MGNLIYGDNLPVMWEAHCVEDQREKFLHRIHETMN
jgi:hypothetical protein